MERGQSGGTRDIPLTQNRTMRRLVHEALTKLGFDPDQVHHDALRLGNARELAFHNQAPHFWSGVASLTDDRHAGLHLAEAVPARLLDEVLLLMYMSLDLREALQRFERFQHLLSGGFQARLEVTPRRREAHLIFDLTYPGFGILRQQAECVALTLIKLLSLCTEGAFRPTGLGFRHLAPEDVSEHQRLLGLTPEFGCEHDRLSFPAKLLDRPLPAANPELAAVIERYTEERLRALDANQFLYRVRFWIDSNLHRPEVTVDDCAEDFGISRIGLRRSLGARNVLFQDLRDDLRRQRAGDMLARGASVADTARACGFYSSPEFHDAFERWFGCPPERFVQRRGDSFGGDQT